MNNAPNLLTSVYIQGLEVLEAQPFCQNPLLHTETLAVPESKTGGVVTQV